MKELSIAEKAKRYDEAIKLAKDSYNYPSYPGFIRADVVFPELKESEDERIKHEIKVILANTDFSRFALDYTFADMIAWLEKQDNNQNWKPSKEQISAIEHFVRSIGESGYASPYDNNIKLLKSLINDLYKLKEQCGQEPFDYENANIKQKDFAPKVEPKFKAGDWITDGNYTWQVINVLALDYVLRSQDGNTVDDTIFYVNEHFHSFTIQDAKVGDVLEFEDHKKVVVGIVSFVSDRTGKVDVSCLLEDNKFKIGNFYALDTINPRPATKEQRDLLFQKMKEAGYERDAEKKILKEIEDESKTADSFQTCKKETLMTLDEAIEHCKEKSCDDTVCGKEHKQLSEWLTELKSYRSSVAQIKTKCN